MRGEIEELPSVSASTPAAEVQQRRRRLRALIYDQRLRRRLLLLFSLFTFLLVGLLTTVVRVVLVLPIDLLASHDLQAIHLRWFEPVMLAVSTIGNRPWAYGVVAAAGVIVGVLLGWRDALYLLAITAVQGILTLLLKTAIGRQRPASTMVDVLVPQQGNSFPSGHVLFYTLFFGFLGFVAWSRLPRSFWRALLIGLCIVLVALVGPSRIYLGAHWLSDVVAAYLLGITLLALAIEGYLALLAPRHPVEHSGLVGHADRNAHKGHKMY